MYYNEEIHINIKSFQFVLFKATLQKLYYTKNIT